MRIIAGKLGGRLFDSPGTHKTHPMGDRVRGGLFGVLGDIEGLRVLDAFAGSGALSFEAVSRGAKEAVTIESDRVAQQIIRQNYESLGLEEKVRLVPARASSWLRTSRGEMFDIVLCDPPYNNLQLPLLERLAVRTKPHGGVAVFSLPPEARLILPEDFRLHTTKSYGDAQLRFFVRD